VATDYYAFGMQARHENAATESEYSYGFQEYERDDDLKGTGNSYVTNARLYDPRVGRWLSPDSVLRATTSPYSAFGNNPIGQIDPDGANPINWMRNRVGRKTIEKFGRKIEEWAARKSGNVVRNEIQRVAAPQLADLLDPAGKGGKQVVKRTLRRLWSEATERTQKETKELINQAPKLTEFATKQVGGPEGALLHISLAGAALYKTIKAKVNIKKLLGGGTGMLIAFTADDAFGQSGIESMTISESGITLVQAPADTPFIDWTDPTTYLGPFLGTFLSTGQELRTEIHISPEGNVTTTSGGAIHRHGRIDMENAPVVEDPEDLKTKE
jgi:RHS repeat-associated protein